MSRAKVWLASEGRENALVEARLRNHRNTRFTGDVTFHQLAPCHLSCASELPQMRCIHGITDDSEDKVASTGARNQLADEFKANTSTGTNNDPYLGTLSARGIAHCRRERYGGAAA
ncbi:MAG: hypothetical protein OHK93_004535 [Ramalina farinacea]|uniref:Uncharacterized protein n=1 Tax=Ramalina farinacea TaxID=258253 RepID=A0AA43TYK5_9LECA|nr:hypothetical protein [Ramalina farinacea]